MLNQGRYLKQCVQSCSPFLMDLLYSALKPRQNSDIHPHESCDTQNENLNNDVWKTRLQIHHHPGAIRKSVEGRSSPTPVLPPFHLQGASRDFLASHHRHLRPFRQAHL